MQTFAEAIIGPALRLWSNCFVVLLLPEKCRTLEWQQKLHSYPITRWGCEANPHPSVNTPPNQEYVRNIWGIYWADIGKNDKEMNITSQNITSPR